MNIKGASVAAVVTVAVTASGCGYRMGAVSPEVAPGSTQVTAAAAASIRTGADTSAPIQVDQTLPPNAQGDPACASPLAWGRHPQGRGVLVTVLAQNPTTVTVLVRTHSGTDVAERAVLQRNDLRLFDFPDVGTDTVSEVLIMTNTARCFAVVDRATFP
ncbi:hypothetical protein JRC04_01935 [Mycolicibacterium sp. S2-37]|uniref:hypothetical protein n=1 Tax=Mycolicibacterium sp. S2-37 TaxID=2810297 RepID=UPI001A93BAFD|nr:hypothetical protein [Mycolicibacterium sp. S2-37]MBO0676218.1 hypothetical protein [Mycolicibacterium sp. S2-37]